jgi:hypothetical protein
MTARIRTQLAALTTLAGTLDGRIPNPWPTRIALHLATIAAHLDSALANLGAAAHTPPEPDHSQPTNPDAAYHAGDRTPSPVEAAAARNSGPGRIALTLSTHIVTAAGHLGIALETHNEPQQHQRSRLAWIELGEACTIVERWQTIDRKERQAMLCSGIHLAGFHEWGSEECPRPASVGPSGSCDLAGLCLECAALREAWRKRDEYRVKGRTDRRGTPA